MLAQEKENKIKLKKTKEKRLSLCLLSIRMADWKLLGPIPTEVKSIQSF